MRCRYYADAGEVLRGGLAKTAGWQRHDGYRSSGHVEEFDAVSGFAVCWSVMPLYDRADVSEAQTVSWLVDRENTRWNISKGMVYSGCIVINRWRACAKINLPDAAEEHGVAARACDRRDNFVAVAPGSLPSLDHVFG